MPSSTPPPHHPKPTPRPAPPPHARPHVDCSKVHHAADALKAHGHPEIAQFLLRVTGCAENKHENIN